MQSKASKGHPKAQVADSACIGFFAALAVSAAIMSGCSTQDPARVKREMHELLRIHDYPGARAVKATPQNIGTSPEEIAKEEVIRNEVNPMEADFISKQITAEVEKRIGAGQFDEARGLVLAPSFDLAHNDLVPEVAKPVAKCKTRLLHERINTTQFMQITNRMHKTVMAALAKNDFATARKAYDIALPAAISTPKFNEFNISLEGTKKNFRDMVNSAETAFLVKKLTAEVEKRIGAGQFDEARDLVWAPSHDLANHDLVPEVAKPIAECKTRLLHERINTTQFIQATNRMHKAVMAALAQNDFVTARKAVDTVKPVRVYSTATTNALANVHKALANAQVPANDVERVVGGLKPVLETIFEDFACQTKTIQPGETFKPDKGKFNEALAALRRTLVDQGLDDMTADKVKNAVDQVASVELRKLWQPQEACDIAPPAAIGTSKLNELLETAKKEQIDEFIVPAQIAYRAKTLHDKVVPLVKAGDLDTARATIHAFGITGHPEVDDPVFAVKLGLLNAHVNVAEWEARREALVKAVTSALAKCNLNAASAAIAADMPVPAYGAPVDKALLVAAAETVKLGRDEEEAGKVVVKAQGNLYETVAPRPEAEREERIMDAYSNEVARNLVEAYGEDPKADWGAVSNALANATALLVADDMSSEDADTFVKEVMAGFRALPNLKADTRPTALTTEKLNDMLSDLKAELSAKVSAAISMKMAATALVAEAATLPPNELARRLKQLKVDAEEKVSPEFAKILFEESSSAAQRNVAAAEKAAAAAAAESERLRKLALEMAEHAASAVDVDARINGFIEAVNDRAAPDINRILGDGARILRLRRAGVKLGREDATSLLAAAVYMGYDDVAAFALALGADIDGAAAKDALRRPVILLAMEFGFKGRAAAILKDANRNARDVNGDGTLHYAVRGVNGMALVDLLREGIDARRPGANGMTPIVLAADIGYAGLVQALVPFSNLEKADDQGFTALLCAARNGRLDIVRNLVAAGANLNAKANNDDGVLELAAMANAPELLNWLLDERKIAPTARVVSQLVEAGNVPTLQQMVAHGAKLTDEHLAAAGERGDFPMVKYLVNQGMDVNAPVVKNAELPVFIRAFLSNQGQRP